MQTMNQSASLRLVYGSVNVDSVAIPEANHCAKDDTKCQFTVS